jgi:hypothetical protein
LKELGIFPSLLADPDPAYALSLGLVYWVGEPIKDASPSVSPAIRLADALFFARPSRSRRRRVMFLRMSQPKWSLSLAIIV